MELKKVALVGFGALGRQILDLAQAVATVGEFIAFDDSREGENIRPFTELYSGKYADYDFLLALGYRHAEKKQEIIDELNTLGRRLPSLAHPTCFVHPSAKLGRAVYLFPMCNVDRGVTIGDGTVLNNSAVVSHGNRIGRCVWISPGAVLSGDVIVGDLAMLGPGAVISNTLRIGAGVTVGAGSVVVKSLGDGLSVVGNPAKPLSHKHEPK